MGVFTEEFNNVAKLLVSKEDMDTYVKNHLDKKNIIPKDEDDFRVKILIDKVAAWCFSNQNGSAIIGQISLPSGDVFPRNNSLFPKMNNYYQRAQSFERMAKRRSEAAETDKADNPRTHYENKLMYFTYALLMLVNNTVTPYDGLAVKTVFEGESPILHSQQFEQQARELFLYLSGSVLNLKKEDLLFDKKGEAQPNLASQLLFGSNKVEKTLSRAKRNAWPATSFGVDVKQSCAADIVNAAIRLPLMAYYLEDNLFLTSRNEILFLLKAITKSVRGVKGSDVTDIVLSPLVSSVIERTKDVLSAYCEQSENTLPDTLGLLGYLAYIASEKELRGEGAAFTPQEVDLNELKNRVQIEETVTDEQIQAGISSLLEDLSDETKGSRGTNLLCRVGATGYQFIVKPLRLSLLAFAMAQECNVKASVDCKTLFETVGRFSHVKARKIGDNVKVNAHFDELVILASALLIQLREDHRMACVEYLCEQARNFSVKQRHRQIGAIYILTAVLYENIPLTHLQRQKIFKATFGRTTYSLQQREWQYLTRCQYYVNEVNRAFARIGEFETDGEKRWLTYQPHYFFLFHEAAGEYTPTDANRSLSLEEIERGAYFYRNRSWETEIPLSEEEEEDLKHLISQTATHIKSIKEETSFETQVRLAYAGHALLYTLSNLYYKNIPPKKNIVGTVNLETILIYADSFLRRHNRLYKRYLQNRMVPNSVESSAGLYLLCGGFRFTSAVKPHKKKSACEMSESIKREYALYLKVESPRFRFLMARMLAFTDFFNIEANKALIPDIALYETLSDLEFMEYDNITVEAIKANPLDPSKWYASECQETATPDSGATVQE